MRCNIDYYALNGVRLRIPVAFHNLRGYDSYIIIEAIGKYKNDYSATKNKLTVILNNMERYMSITYEYLVFIDSYLVT